MVSQSRDIDLLVIHCAATPNGRPYNARDVDVWHRDRGFKREKSAAKAWQPEMESIGYHGVIEVDGAFVPGRHFIEVGAHATPLNRHSVGLCLIGTDQFTPRQWATLAWVVTAWRAALPILGVVGHRAINGDKTCPGFDVDAWLDGGMAPLHQHLLETPS